MGNKTNFVHDDNAINVAVTHPSTPIVGKAVMIGDVPGVCLEKEDSDGKAVVGLRGIYRLKVDAHNGSAATAISIGDKITYTSTRTTENLSVTPAGDQFGYAMEAATAGLDKEILILLRGE